MDKKEDEDKPYILIPFPKFCKRGEDDKPKPVWLPLIESLYGILTMQDKKNCIIHINQTAKTYTVSLKKLFSYFPEWNPPVIQEHDEYNTNNGVNCICGVPIFNVYQTYYKNELDYKKPYPIGSCCIDMWISNLSLETKRRQKVGCPYCGRKWENENKRECSNCSGKKLARSVLKNWNATTKKFKKEKEDTKRILSIIETYELPFGMYKNTSIKVIYEQNPSYLTWFRNNISKCTAKNKVCVYLNLVENMNF